VVRHTLSRAALYISILYVVKTVSSYVISAEMRDACALVTFMPKSETLSCKDLVSSSWKMGQDPHMEVANPGDGDPCWKGYCDYNYHIACPCS